jgi:hypothetical protein
MRATQDKQVISLFGGECIAPGFRGRRSAPQFRQQTSRHLAVVVGALLIGFATAATAITVRTHRIAADDFSHSVPANMMVAPQLAGFDAAVY